MSDGHKRIRYASIGLDIQILIGLDQKDIVNI